VRVRARVNTVRAAILVLCTDIGSSIRFQFWSQSAPSPHTHTHALVRVSKVYYNTHTSTHAHMCACAHTHTCTHTKYYHISSVYFSVSSLFLPVQCSRCHPLLCPGSHNNVYMRSYASNFVVLVKTFWVLFIASLFFKKKPLLLLLLLLLPKYLLVTQQQQ